MHKFSLDFTTLNNNTFVWLKLNMPYDFATIKAELESETTWQLDNPTWYPDGKRYKCHQPTSPILREIKDYFGSASTRRTLCETACENFSGIPGGRWLMNADQLFESTSSHCEFNRDLPGFEQHIHVDFKFLLCTGFAYLTEHDDPQVSSYFYSDRQGSNPQRATTNFGDGWFAFNDHDSWHSGGNFSDYTRYSMLIGLTLMKNPLYKGK
jgi:hypothetical protein